MSEVPRSFADHTALNDGGASARAAPMVSGHGLRSMDMLAHLDDQRLIELAAQCQWRRLEPQQHLENAFSDHRLHLLVQGSVWVTHYSANGREMALGDVVAGECFGDCPQTPGPPVCLDVVAAEPCLVASLSEEDAMALIESEPLVLRAVLIRLGSLVRALARRVVALGTLSVRGRLQTWLLALAERSGIENNQAVIKPAPLQSTLASLLGTSREEVAREMSRLRRLGLLRREGSSLLLCDIQGLRSLLEDGG